MWLLKTQKSPPDAWYLHVHVYVEGEVFQTGEKLKSILTWSLILWIGTICTFGFTWYRSSNWMRNLNCIVQLAFLTCMCESYSHSHQGAKFPWLLCQWRVTCRYICVLRWNFKRLHFRNFWKYRTLLNCKWCIFSLLNHRYLSKVIYILLIRKTS